MATRITQNYVEVLVTPTTAKTRITQAYAETLVSPTTALARITQLYVEVLVTEGAPPAAGRKYGPAIQMM